MNRLAILLTIVFLSCASCTVHPAGEQDERHRAAVEGQRYMMRPEDRSQPSLPANPSRDELVQYADLASPELEQRFWEWKAAIEQIPQDGTQPTNLVLYANVPLTHGSTAFNRTVLTAANDPMADIQWPSKPTTAARRALQEARVAGLRFQQAKRDLRQKVLGIYADYAATAQLLRLEKINAQLLATIASVAQAGVPSGKTAQPVAMNARNEVELSKNRIAELDAKMGQLRAALNAAIGREPEAVLSLPPSLPPLRRANFVSSTLLKLISERSIELASLDADEQARDDGLKLAKLQYVPDFSLSASTDLGGAVQNLMGMVTVPLLRYQAIDAAIAQAEANLRKIDSMRRQTAIDLRSRIVGDVAMLDQLQRQAISLESIVIPRAQAIAQLDQSIFEIGGTPLMTIVDAQRSLIELRRLDVNIRSAYETTVLDIENVVGPIVN
ncbi:MAG: TolC family protein [Phycisphaerae bacterium]|nr:TolC family protein [Phycisphaerae bacterium]